jgi:hypothetical protein
MTSKITAAVAELAAANEEVRTIEVVADRHEAARNAAWEQNWPNRDAQKVAKLRLQGALGSRARAVHGLIARRIDALPLPADLGIRVTLAPPAATLPLRPWHVTFLGHRRERRVGVPPSVHGVRLPGARESGAVFPLPVAACDVDRVEFVLAFAVGALPGGRALAALLDRWVATVARTVGLEGPE